MSRAIISHVQISEDYYLIFIASLRIQLRYCTTAVERNHITASTEVVSISVDIRAQVSAASKCAQRAIL
jgi:hypothetical protein